MGPLALRPGLTLLVTVSFAVSITAVRRHPKFNPGTVLFIRIQQKLREFCCFTKTQRQKACRQWIKTAGMPRLVRIKQSLRHLQGAVGGNAGGFIENKDAIDLTTTRSPIVSTTGSSHLSV